MIMDQRDTVPVPPYVVSGNVLLLLGKKYSPPFKISAIGPMTVCNELDDSKEITIYRRYVNAFGLGWRSKRQAATRPMRCSNR